MEFSIECDMLEFSIKFGIEFEMEFGIEFDMDLVLSLICLSLV